MHQQQIKASREVAPAVVQPVLSETIPWTLLTVKAQGIAGKTSKKWGQVVILEFVLFFIFKDDEGKWVFFKEEF